MLRQSVQLLARNGCTPAYGVSASQWGSVASNCGLASSTFMRQAVRLFSAAAAQQSGLLPAWVFLGPPGVGKGTYATRVADWLTIPHVAAGDLVREEIKSGSALGKEMARIANSGDLLPDEMVTRLLRKRVQRAQQEGEPGVLLDGFPRTVAQADELLSIADVQLALNLRLREDVLLEKCLGRRICSKCGKNYNIADINASADPARGLPAIVMPPLNPPPECEQHLETRADDTPSVVQHRLTVYKRSAAPLEAFFRQQGLLMDFDITGGIPETLPRLKAALEPHAHRLRGASSGSSSNVAAA